MKLHFRRAVFHPGVKLAAVPSPGPDRRIRFAVVLLAFTASLGRLPAQAPSSESAAGRRMPGYLAGYEALYATSPHEAAQKWFRDARYGLMIHYCLASVLDRGRSGYTELARRLQANTAKPDDAMNPDEAARGPDRYLFARFTAEAFDAGKIADLAVAAGMKYVNFTTTHLGGMAMWNTSLTDFNSTKSPAHRDLVAELAAACAQRRLGLFLYVPPDTTRTDGDHFEHNRRMLTELLSNYGPIAGIWFDGIQGFRKFPQRYTRVQELFDLVRRLQPQCLVSWKSSADGTDFLAPEHTVGDLLFRHPGFPVEVCTTLQKCRRRDLITDETGWINNDSTPHLSTDAIIMMIRELQLEQATNIALNIGLRGNGSIHPDDEAALRAVGAYIRTNWSNLPESNPALFGVH